MAIKFGFFDAAYDEQTGKYDRQYFSEDMSKLFSVITGNGIFKNDRNALEVVASGISMSVAVSTGFCIALGRYMNNTEAYTLTLTPPASNKRIDMIVARVSIASNERNFRLMVKQGVAAANPQPPTLVRNDGIYELCLAKITLTSSTVIITDDIIEDTRADKELCGYVSGLGGGGDAEIIDCTINNSASTYAQNWLLDENGSAFQPEPKKIYRVISEGKYENCLYIYDETSTTYDGVASYCIELTAAEARALWSSSQAIVLENIPAQQGSLQYNGLEQTPNWLYYDPTKLRIGGTNSATNAGTYHTTFEPINGYVWPDGTVTVKDITWSITKKLVPIPSPVQTIFNYDGYEKQVVFDNLDATAVTLTNTKATNTGDYVITAALRDITNTCWQDETYVQRAWPFKIVGRQNMVTLSKNTVTFAAATDTDTVTVSSTGSGIITARSMDENIVTATVSGNTITLAPGNTLVKGATTVIVEVSGNPQYAIGTAEITVNKNYGIKYVTWADGTDAEIADMVAAADNGDIDLHDYWSVGDERVVRLSAMTASGSNTFGSWNVGEPHVAQDITLVLMDTDRYELETPVLNMDGTPRNRCSFVVGMKNALLETGYLQSGNTPSQTTVWGTMHRRYWCDAAFPGALPTDLVSAFKRFNVIFRGQNNYSISSIVSLFSMFSLGEITEVEPDYYDDTERNAVLPVLEYYNTPENRIKHAGLNGGIVKYWTRSSFTYKTSGSGGSAGSTYINNNYIDTNGEPIGTYNGSKPIDSECHPYVNHSISVFGCI